MTVQKAAVKGGFSNPCRALNSGVSSPKSFLKMFSRVEGLGKALSLSFKCNPLQF